MSKLNIKLLSDICAAPGVSGFEVAIRNLVLKSIEGQADEISVDNVGNVIALKKGKSSDKKVMLMAHMDEIGFIVSHIDDGGFIRFQPLGGFDPKTLTAQRVIIHGKQDTIGVMGCKPIHIMSAKERAETLKITDFFIDTGMKKEEVLKHVSIGDPITRERDLIEMGDCVNCKSIDNRVSVFVLIELLKQVKSLDYDTYFAFTVQEEVGLRGAMVATHNISPDFGINLDTTIAYDVADAKEEEMITKLGHGTAIKYKDSSVICDYRMVNFLKGIADKKNIKWQAELLPAGGTDTGYLQRMGHNGGTIAGALSIPTRNLHQVIEMAHKEDIQATIDLFDACLSEIAGFDWSF
ncbi:UNVERIFIED_CONTAM: hypothetical protein GTU68_066420 [Idotea baltica]|nr:hypothetical protein [Idotea baltica]